MMDRSPGDSTPASVHRHPAVIPAAERDAAVERLSAAFANDALSLEEFERRVEAVYQAPTSNAIVQLVQDLPGAASPATHDALMPATPMSPRLAVAFGSVERDGRVLVPARVDLRAVFGNIELDLREAEFAPGVTEICIHAVVANVEVQLPTHVGVENHGETFLGSFASRVKGSDRPDRNLPAFSTARVLITGRAVLGNVEIEREAPGDQ